MSDEKLLCDMETFFLALADKTRLRLLNLMREKEICVGFFVEILGESQPKISRHLAYLKSAGIISARRDGKWIYYRIVKPKSAYAAQVLKDLLEWLASNTEMQNDYEKLAIAGRALPIFAPDSYVPAEKTNRNKSEELEIFLL